ALIDDPPSLRHPPTVGDGCGNARHLEWRDYHLTLAIRRLRQHATELGGGIRFGNRDSQVARGLEERLGPHGAVSELREVCVAGSRDALSHIDSSMRRTIHLVVADGPFARSGEVADSTVAESFALERTVRIGRIQAESRHRRDDFERRARRIEAEA